MPHRSVLLLSNRSVSAFRHFLNSEDCWGDKDINEPIVQSENKLLLRCLRGIFLITLRDRLACRRSFHRKEVLGSDTLYFTKCKTISCSVSSL